MVRLPRFPNGISTNSGRSLAAPSKLHLKLNQERRPGGSSSGESWKEVISLHANGIDAPVAVRKTGRTTLVPRENWQGDYEIGTTANGTPTSLCNGALDCPLIQWPGSVENADGLNTDNTKINTWWGSLISEKLDASGMKYMRNRYYNPNTGQFTQQDPIGLAGGLNLYGFAAGDPVNFSDPMGLCPPKDRNYKDCDTSRPDRDPEFRKKLEAAGRRAEANTWLTLAVISGLRGLITGGMEGIRSLVAGSEGAKATAPSLEVVFGHGARHLEGTGLDAAKIETVIKAQVLRSAQDASKTGTFWGRVAIKGQTVEYRAFTLQPGRINVGTYYPIK